MNPSFKKKALLFIVFIGISLFSFFAFGQTSYIQVSGEPNLTVFLDGELKGITNAEMGGLIIEKVTPGNHLIKVVKKEYVPFEESILVKPGEVLLYKIKPFAKLAVVITEKGNEEETDKKATIQTGKLIIQSLPIEIAITIPRIEGVKNLKKNKDQWMIEKLAIGEYQSTFSFNGKTLDQSFQIKTNQETHVFVNILSGEVTVKYSAEEAKKKQEENAALLKTLFQDILSWTDVKLNQNLEVIKKSNPEMYKRFDRFGRVSGTLLYSYTSNNGNRTYLNVDDDYITKIGFYKNLGSEESADEFFDNYYRQFESVTPKDDFINDTYSSGVYKKMFEVNSTEMNLHCEVFISKSNPKIVTMNIEKIKK